MTPGSGRHSDRLVIHSSRSKLALFLLGATAFVVSGLRIGSPDSD